MICLRREIPTIAWLPLIMAVLLLRVVANGQQPDDSQIPQGPHLVPRTENEREENYRAEHHFILNVQVQDEAGKSVSGLGESNFTLLDNGQKEKIASLREAKGVGAGVPPRVMLLLDAVNSTPHNLRAIHDGIEQFLRSGSGPTELPISMALMTDAGITIDVPTQDRDLLGSELASFIHVARPNVCEMGVVQSMGWGPTQSSRPGYLSCLNLHFKLSVSYLSRLAEKQMNIPGRLILIWFGAGWPHLSGGNFAPDTDALKRSFFDYLVELSDALREGQVTMDAVQASGPVHMPDLQKKRDLEGMEAVTSENQVTAASLSLEALAVESGGMLLEGPADLPSKIAASMADAESYYVLTFDSAVAKAPGEYHSIEVKIDKPGLTARTVRYYYAAP